MFNVPFNEEGVPEPIPNEIFILRRDGISFKATCGPAKHSASGCIHLTTMRIVFVAYKDKPGFRSFAIPLHQLRNEKFKQPIFGANYIQGDVIGVERPGLAGTADVHTRITFKEGGVGTFIHFFIDIMRAIRETAAQQGAPPPAATHPALAAQAPSYVAPPPPATSQAFVDPSDPSVLYVAQPSAPPPPRAASASAAPVASPYQSSGQSVPVASPAYSSSGAPVATAAPAPYANNPPSSAPPPAYPRYSV